MAARVKRVSEFIRAKMNGKLLDLKASELLARFGQGKPVPGSGSAAALQGILAVQLIATVTKLTKEPKRHKNYANFLHRLHEIENHLERRILPKLEHLFQKDSDQFGEVIRLREHRDATKESNPTVSQQTEDEMLEALKIATQTVTDIATLCAELASFACEVFDRGFSSARGDSSVAINAAISGLAGCIAIIDLNLLSFLDSRYLDQIKESQDNLSNNLDSLKSEATRRLNEQMSELSSHVQFSKELDKIRTSLKGRKAISDEQIEVLATDLQRLIWRNRDLVWKRNPPQSPLKVLDAPRTLKCLGYVVARPATLGNFTDRGVQYEVAGQIDQKSRVVSISKQFSNEVIKFTEAHELGHSLLHTQSVLHRDRPLDGTAGRLAENSVERQANKFAACFLMPRKLVHQKFHQIFGVSVFRITHESALALNMKNADELYAVAKSRHGLSRHLSNVTQYGSRQVHSLTELFGVSSEAMAIRLEELGVVDF